MNARDPYPMGFREELAERIKTARAARGVSQKHLARVLNVRDASPSDWERGVNTPEPEKLVALAPLLGVSVQWLLTGEEVPPSSPPPPMPALHAFLATPLGQTATEDERAMLEAWKITGKPPTEATYATFLAGLRGTR